MWLSCIQDVQIYFTADGRDLHVFLAWQHLAGLLRRSGWGSRCCTELAWKLQQRYSGIAVAVILLKTVKWWYDDPRTLSKSPITCNIKHFSGITCSFICMGNPELCFRVKVLQFMSQPPGLTGVHPVTEGFALWCTDRGRAGLCCSESSGNAGGGVKIPAASETQGASHMLHCRSSGAGRP